MRFKFNGSRRDKFAKAKYRATNCAGYNEAPRVHSGRDWMQEKRRFPKARRAWRKLHIAMDPERGDRRRYA